MEHYGLRRSIAGGNQQYSRSSLSPLAERPSLLANFSVLVVAGETPVGSHCSQNKRQIDTRKPTSVEKCLAR